jgi:putative ABC transport system substrate-binding protein
MDALLVTSDGLFLANRTRIIEFVARHRLPATYPGSYMVEEGGLMSYVSPQTWRYQRAAELVDKILKGANPGDLPIERASRFELFVNARTAKALRINIPQSILLRADRVIE